ncbi:MAG: polyprenyl diphosphate synthase [Sideroxydans sp.]|nr:polyprenyl diphosphate synthase [Sideroxydans sp.]
MALFQSSTSTLPEVTPVPRHIAVIMDGNGRWAKQRFMPRVMGHQRGVESVRSIVKACNNKGVGFLTLFAFSSENWRRPADEVTFLMKLFLKVLEKEVSKMHASNIRLRIIGDRTRFDEALVRHIENAEKLTAANTGLVLTIAANYGGRWDVMQAMHGLIQANPNRTTAFEEDELTPYLSMNYAPDPDLFIRTGGEQRISNFLLWQLAYTELYVTDTLWPAFDLKAFELALESYQKRERRFGRISEQLKGEKNA